MNDIQVQQQLQKHLFTPQLYVDRFLFWLAAHKLPRRLWWRQLRKYDHVIHLYRTPSL